MINSHMRLIALIIFFALVIALMPLPFSLEPFRPDWVLLVLMYWSLALPHRLNIGTAWVVGLLIDLATGSSLGVNSLTYSVCIFVNASNFGTYDGERAYIQVGRRFGNFLPHITYRVAFLQHDRVFISLPA